MKRNIKHNILSKWEWIFVLMIFWGVSLHFSACVKWTPLASPEEGNIFMPQAYSDRANLSLYYIDTSQAITFGAAYGGFKNASQDITANFEVDTSLIKQYNIDNAYLGNTYIALPNASYTIPSLSAILKAGATSSEPLSILLNTSKLKIGTHYLLPIKLTSISSGTLDTALSVAFFKIDTLYTRSKDITDVDTVAFTYNYNDAPQYNDFAETVQHLVDSNYTTKYFEANYHTDLYVQLQFKTPTVVNAYTLTSGNDSPERDPKDWNLSGSNDGHTWTVLATETDKTFLNRLQTIQFNANNNTAYSYYRLNVTANNNNNTGAFQCTEWRLLQFY